MAQILSKVTSNDSFADTPEYALLSITENLQNAVVRRTAAARMVGQLDTGFYACEFHDYSCIWLSFLPDELEGVVDTADLNARGFVRLEDDFDADRDADYVWLDNDADSMLVSRYGFTFRCFTSGVGAYCEWDTFVADSYLDDEPDDE